jgi:hypothetical protein
MVMGMSMADGRPRRRDDLSSREVEGERILLDDTTKQVHQLNLTASFIWQRCDGGHTVAQIVDALVQAFDVDGATARDAVLTSLRQFREVGLLQPGGE